METDVNQDFEDYWNEYKIIQETKLLDEYLDELDDENSPSYDEGEQETEWLHAAGLSHLTEPYLQGREVAESDLGPAIRYLSPHQAAAVRRRVQTLNHTVRQRRGRSRKPDIRDVFRDVEISSTGTRSRSATPDSLDELHSDETQSPSPPWPISSSRQVASEWSGNAGSPTRIFISKSPSRDPVYEKDVCDDVFITRPKDVARRLPSISQQPLREAPYDFFRHTNAWGSNKKTPLGGDVALDNSEGIQMLGYQRISLVHLPQPSDKLRTGTDPITAAKNDSNYKHSQSRINGVPVSFVPEKSKLSVTDRHLSLSRSHSNLYTLEDTDGASLASQRGIKRVSLRRTSSQGHLGFEEMCRRNQQNVQLFPHEGTRRPISAYVDNSLVGRTWIEYLGEADVRKLRPLLLLEVTALFDSCNISFHKRKTPKRKRKEDTNLFGVPLATLLERDKLLMSEPGTVPLIFQKVLNHLERHGAREEGILRVAGHKQKVEVLRAELERDFYSHPEQAERLLQQASCHDMAAILKRLLRDLPQPLLTAEYIDMFYQAHALPDEATRGRALNLLVLLLPAENRCTLRALFTFLGSVIRHQNHNKMTAHNVAMIMAPSLFTPCYIHPSQKSDLKAQVNMAAVCCRLMEALLQCGKILWVVPEELVAQLRQQNEEDRYKRGAKENNTPMRRFLGKKGGLREPITRKINNEVDFQEGVVRVNAPQFQMISVPVKLAEHTTAGDVVLRLVEEARARSDLTGVDFKVLRRPHSRALAELAPNGNLSCILATGYPLQTHFLYEIGGNIAQRLVEHTANLLGVYKDNPNTQWTLRCHHRNAKDAVFT